MDRAAKAKELRERFGVSAVPANLFVDRDNPAWEAARKASASGYRGGSSLTYVALRLSESTGDCTVVLNETLRRDVQPRPGRIVSTAPPMTFPTLGAAEMWAAIYSDPGDKFLFVQVLADGVGDEVRVDETAVPSGDELANMLRTAGFQWLDTYEVDGENVGPGWWNGHGFVPNGDLVGMSWKQVGDFLFYGLAPGSDAR